MNIRTLTYAFVVVCCSLRLSAQTPIKFSHLSTDQGLSHNDVKTILQDSKGFMWFGTANGLNKFDGYTFTVYKHDKIDSTSILNNTVSVLREDAAGNLWIVANAPGLSKL